MKLFLKELSRFATCVFVILSYSSSALADLDLNRGKHDIIQVEGKPRQFECTLTGTEKELEGKKINWIVPGVKDRTPTPFKDSDGTITNITSPGKFTSILNVPMPPALEYASTVLLYKCDVPGFRQTSFPFVLVKANAVPKIDPIKKEPTEKGEIVNLVCSVSYENDNPNNNPTKFGLSLAWTKDGKYLQNVLFPYKFGTFSPNITYQVTIRNFKDGGNYACQWKLTYTSAFIMNNYTLELQISPYIDGPSEKEVKDTAGSDVELICDVQGYPITFDWRYEDDEKIVGDNRIKVKNNILTIDDIEYEDRKKYICVGTVTANKTVTELKQTIILRVKDPLAALWPFIGILIEAVVIAAIIFITERYRSRNESETDSADPKTETTEQPSTSQT